MVEIAVVGDVILDKYDYCSNRENPESTAPCYVVEKTVYKPGGAGNVAANLKSLGSDVDLFGVIGEDSNARVLAKLLSELGINSFFVKDKSRPTIVKERVLSAGDGRYHFRKDLEKKEYLSSAHSTEIVSALKKKRYSAILVSDYNKGVISGALMDEIKRIGRETGAVVIVDPKPAHKNLYKDVFLVKLNLKEAREMANPVSEQRDRDDDSAAKKIMRELNTNVLLTKGSEGMCFFGLGGNELRIKAEAKKAFDVTGAGDTVIAALAHFYCKGSSLEDAIALSSRAAAIAVAHPGCYQVKESELL